MQLKHAVKYVSHPTALLMTLTLSLLPLALLQFFIPLIISSFYTIERLPKSPQPELTEAQQRQKRITDAGKEFLPDGTLHLIYSASTTLSGTSRSVWEVRDVNDSLLWTGKKEDLPYKYLSSPMKHLGGIDAQYIESAQKVSLLFSREFVIPVVPSIAEVTEYWRYEPDRRCFVGFDANDKRIGYLGANGFTKSANKIQPFEELTNVAAWSTQNSYSPMLFWQTINRLYKIDFPARSLNIIFDAENQQIDQVRLCKWRPIKERYASKPDDEEYRPTLHIRTKDGRHHLLLRDPNQRLTIKPPEPWAPTLGKIVPARNKILLIHSDNQARCARDEYRYKPYKEWVELYHIEPPGNLNLLNRFEWTNPNPQKPLQTKPYKDFSNRLAKVSYHLATFSPPLFDLIWQSCHNNIFARNLPKGVNQFLFVAVLNPGSLLRLPDKPHYAASRPLNWAFSLLMASLALLHAWPRRSAWLTLIFWPLFVLVFNLPGLLTYLVLNHSPVIKCPACGKARGLERAECARCGAALPSPQPAKFDLISDT